jgi:type I restriction enzyme S subunit
VDFDPVRAKAEGRQPAGMDAATAALFPDRFEETALGPVPAGWDVKPLPETILINPKRSLIKQGFAPYLEMSNMPNSSARVMGWELREPGSGMRFTNGDVLVARITPCLENGKTAFVDFLEDGQVGWGSTEYIVLRAQPPLPAEYAYFLARTDDFRSHAIVNMTGTSGRQRVSAECFNSYLVVVPPTPIAKRFGQFVGPIMSALKAHDNESHTLAAIRDALLPKLLSGEVRVSAAERLVEAQT